MRTPVKILALSAAAMLLWACEDVIQIRLDEGSKLYVIDAFVNDLPEEQRIRVVTNDSYFSDRDAPPVSTAQVELLDLTASKHYTFTYTGNGYYTCKLIPGDSIAKAGHSYELRVTIDGFTYTSSALQKRGARIEAILPLPAEGGFGPAHPGDDVHLVMLARDKADNNPDYYWIKTFRNDTLFSAPQDLSISIDGTNGIVTNAPEDSIYFTPPGSMLGFKSFRKDDKCRVEIHSLSRENYFFFLQALNQINNGGLFATTPENVKTNIVNPEGAKVKATGRFNMATVAVKTVTVQ